MVRTTEDLQRAKALWDRTVGVGASLDDTVTWDELQIADCPDSADPRTMAWVLFPFQFYDPSEIIQRMLDSCVK